MFTNIKFTENNIDFAFARNIYPLEDLEEHCFLSPKEKEYYSTFRSLQRKKEFLTVRILLQEKYDKSFQISYKESGQPFIKNNKELNISISHNKDWVVIAISKRQIGIDIEKVSKKILRIKEKFCSKKELENIDSNQETKHLSMLWSAKESAYKILQDKSIIFNEDLIANQFIPKENGTFNIPFLKKNLTIPIHYQFIEESIFTYCYL